MPETASSTLVILLACIIGLLFWLALVSHGISRSLLRIEKRLDDDSSRPDPAPAAPSAAETAAGGAFESFLSEDPGRRKMSKAEQFAAYRKWRQENGLNWSNS